jgi:hypothetical protein
MRCPPTATQENSGRIGLGEKFSARSGRGVGRRAMQCNKQMIKKVAAVSCCPTAATFTHQALAASALLRVACLPIWGGRPFSTQRNALLRLSVPAFTCGPKVPPCLAMQTLGIGLIGAGLRDCFLADRSRRRASMRRSSRGSYIEYEHHQYQGRREGKSAAHVSP